MQASTSQIVETRHVACTDTRRIHCGGPGWQEPAIDSWRFLPSVAGGSYELPADEQASRDRVLLWQLQTHTASTLQLAEVSAAYGQIGDAVSLEIEGQAFASAAFTSASNGEVAIILLFADKTAARIRLPRPASSGRRHAAGASSSVLDALHPGSLQRLPLALQLTNLGAPSALAVVGNHLVIAGASDSITCVPLTAFDSGDASGAQHLLTSTSLLQRLVGSLYQPAQRTGVVAAISASDAAGRPFLALVHDNAALRLWAAPPAQQLVASHDVLPSASARQAVPRAALAAGGAAPGELIVVTQLELADTPGNTIMAATHLRLGGADGGGGGPEGASIAAQYLLQLPALSARLLGAQLRGTTLHVLALLPAGETRLMAFSARDGSYLGRAELLSKGPSADWGAYQDLWAATLAAFPSSTSPEDSVVGQLLIPGQLCRVALRETLIFWGAALSQEQVDATGYEQLKVYLQAALLSVAARHPAFTQAQCWHALFARYCESWQQLHAPLALAGAGGGAWLGVIRSGLMLTLLRQATRLEEEEGTKQPATGSTERAVVASCLQAVGQALGSPALRLMMRLVTTGVDLEGSLLPGMVDLLMYGPMQQQAAGGWQAGGQGQVGDVGGGGAMRKRLAEWRVARQAALLHVQQALDGLVDPVESISDYAEELLLANEPSARPPAAQGTAPTPQLPAALGSALCSSVLQAARARCLTAQKLLLLLGVVQRMGRAGGKQLAPEQQARISGQLLPRLCTALRASAMALWLVKTPAACAPGVGGAAAANAAVLPQHLQALQIGGPGRGGSATPRTPLGADGGAFGSQQQQQTRGVRPVHEQPLAAHLLRGFCQARPSEAAGAAAGHVGPAVSALLEYLCAGAVGVVGSSGGGSMAEAGRQRASVRIETRALHIGWRIFCAREFPALGALVELAGGAAPADAGLAFLLGVSLACRLRGFGGSGPAGEQARRELLDAASGHLFRAAAGLAAPEAAPLRNVLQQLRRRQQRGGGAGGGVGGSGLDLAPSVSSDAANGDDIGAQHALPPEVVPHLRLEFFEAVMRLFEAEECLEGALEFAQAALGAVDAAYSLVAPARQERQGSLWMAVFTYASRLGRYSEAYTAASANPMPQHRLECVRRLVHRLAEERRLAVLCGLPFAGVVTPEPSAADPAPQPVPLVKVAVEVLTRRAQHSSLAGGPAPRGPAPRGAAHAALFDLLVCWGDHKGAAAAMLGLAWRLRAEAQQSDEAMREVEDAYAAALNQLELLEPSDAWLDTAHLLLADCSPLAVAAAQGGGGEGDEAVTLADGLGGADDEEGDGGDARSWQQLTAAAGGQQQRRQGGRRGGSSIVVTIVDLQREAALFSAAAALAGLLPGLQVLRAPALPPDYVYDQTLGAGRLSEAEVLAHVLWCGGELEERLERLAAAAAARCMRTQQGGEAAEPMERTAASDEAGDGCGGSGTGGQLTYLGNPAAGGWQRLRSLLARYESADRQRLAGRLRIAAIDAALSEAPGATLPAWLLAPFSPAGAGGMAGAPDDPASLLRVYLRHGRLEDAASLALEHLSAWQATNPLQRCKPAAAWMPLRHLQLLDACLEDAAAAAAAAQHQQQQRDDQEGGARAGVKAVQRFGELKSRLRTAVGDHLALGARDSRMAAARVGGQGATGMALG